jgi:hypothetical protein
MSINKLKNGNGGYGGDGYGYGGDGYGYGGDGDGYGYGGDGDGYGYDGDGYGYGGDGDGDGNGTPNILLCTDPSDFRALIINATVSMQWQQHLPTSSSCNPAGSLSECAALTTAS